MPWPQKMLFSHMKIQFIYNLCNVFPFLIISLETRYALLLAFLHLMVCGHAYIILERAGDDTREDRGMTNDGMGTPARDHMSFVARPRFSSPSTEKRSSGSAASSTSLDDLSTSYLQIRDALNDDLNENGYVLVRDVATDNSGSEAVDNAPEERKQTEMAGQHRIKWRFFNKPGKRQQQQVPMFQNTRFGGGYIRSAVTAEEETRGLPGAAYRVLYRARIGGGSGRRSALPYGGLTRPRFHSSEINEKKRESSSASNYKIVAVLEDENY